GFVPEVPLSFADAYQYILDMGGIPTYPILADGAAQMSPVEWPPASLADWLTKRNIHAVELIPNRNAGEIVDRYVRELDAAGFVVMAGTEHNTPDQIPLQPESSDGALSDRAREVFYAGACVVAAHQARRQRGVAGFVDGSGELAVAREELAAEGDRIIRRYGPAREQIQRIAPRLRGAFATGTGPAAVVSDLGCADDAFPDAPRLELSDDDTVLTEKIRALAAPDVQVVVCPGVGAFGIGPSVAAARAALAGQREDSEPPRGRLAGKIAMVTGAAQGFGLGISEALLAEGASVILADLNVTLAAENAARLCDQYGAARALALRIDVGDEQSCRNAVANVAALVGGVDLFVSNAGVLRAESVLTQPVADFDLVTQVNYRGYFLCVQAIAPLMVAQRQTDPSRWLDIVEVNSKSGLEGSKRNFAYAGSKFGGIGLTQSFALELVEHGIKVNAVCPGNYLDGPLWMDPDRGLFVQYLRAGKVPGATSIADVRAHYEAKVPMGRGCLPIDLARAIFYITEQSYETGQALPVTGGQNMLN
ncbi:MAG: SDR family NAD(P)-dependent oxidoreductase, partial [Bowdeniella nasicola]|nr:SDR family NAD(P)-dependent oxidoreductase [Bowdeniella nasicola]